MAGVYKMVFQTGTYFEQQGKSTFYPSVEVSAGNGPSLPWHS